MKTLTLRPGKERSLLRHHPWVFQGSIAKGGADPGETVDLSGSDPARFTAMQKDYVAFAKVNKVLPMPEGYTAPKQIFANAMRTLLVPRLLELWPLGALLGIAIATAIWWRRRRNTR